MIRRLAAAAIILVALVACGRRGAPVAPELRLPRPVANLSALVHAGSIELSWTNPTRRVDNTRLRDLETVRVFRTEDAGIGEPRAAMLQARRVRGYTEIARIRLASPTPAVVQGEQVRFEDRTSLTFGRRYTYTVIAIDMEGRTSAPSPRVSATYVAAPDPPRDVVADAGEREARLRWAAPTRLTDGNEITDPLRYDVLRAPGPDAPLAVIAETTEPRFVDRNLENEQTYAYATRAVRLVGSTRVVSALTPRVTVTPVAMTPPAPPHDLVAIPSAGSVRLSWLPSASRDVGRYVIYRARGGAPFERVGSVTPPGTTFTDSNVPAGEYRYAVTAQDTSSRRNESAQSNVVRVSVP